jgi:hypothetical protein
MSTETKDWYCDTIAAEHEASQELREKFQGRIVSHRRNWNNSMGIYSDSIIVLSLDSTEFKTYGIGTDYFDRYHPDKVIDASEAVLTLYKAYKDGIRQKIEDGKIREKKENISVAGFIDKNQTEWFLSLPDSHFLPVINLFIKNIRSKFKISLRNQIEKWLQDKPENRKYDSPLSSKQWNCLLGTGDSSSCYYNRSHYGYRRY